MRANLSFLPAWTDVLNTRLDMNSRSTTRHQTRTEPGGQEDSWRRLRSLPARRGSIPPNRQRTSRSHATQDIVRKLAFFKTVTRRR